MSKRDCAGAAAAPVVTPLLLLPLPLAGPSAGAATLSAPAAAAGGLASNAASSAGVHPSASTLLTAVMRHWPP